MITLMKKIDLLIEPLRKIANCVGAPLWDLAARLYLAQAFFLSGLTRYRDWAAGNFDSQIFLFEYEHPVPGLSPELAAYGATISELVLPLVLTVGLFGRVGAAGILIMTAIIEFTYIHAPEHILWGFLALSIFIKGPGILSVDAFIRKFIAGKGV